ncbi:F-box protein At5g49610-like [Triticum dicoccoides]|uniref:F-box protein At5g49610-like n=1 Tax=Triticum dicoccoides TaxID=85692 RepID=UPI000E7CE335|nr:F-box protein At5g49610-like [Triticum dicoccoides]
MDTENGFLAAKLTDDLVVEILSRLPFKSFCRFKCVCKAWLAFSSNPDYCKELLKIPMGLLYQHRYDEFDNDFDDSAIKLASLPHNDKEFDEALSFLPQYEQLELLDSCNGLVLCKYKSSCTPFGICCFIVCNPATREWKVLPDTPPSDYKPFCNVSFLAFSPSWSTKFYIFNSQRPSTRYWVFGPVKFQVFLSDLNTWFLYDTSVLFEAKVSRPHMFIDGALYVHTGLHDILVLKSLEETSSGIPPSLRTIKLPHEDGAFMGRFGQCCFGQSSGALHYALPEEDARTILVWSLDVDEPYEWSLKYRLNMSQAFGRDNLCQHGAPHWKSDYAVVALDLERDGLFLIDKREDKIRLYKISTGGLTHIQPEDHCSRFLNNKYYHYVASYSKLPALTM